MHWATHAHTHTPARTGFMVSSDHKSCIPCEGNLIGDGNE